jgi:hypothetical protein
MKGNGSNFGCATSRIFSIGISGFDLSIGASGSIFAL